MCILFGHLYQILAGVCASPELPTVITQIGTIGYTGVHGHTAAFDYTAHVQCFPILNAQVANTSREQIPFALGPNFPSVARMQRTPPPPEGLLRMVAQTPSPGLLSPVQGLLPTPTLNTRSTILATPCSSRHNFLFLPPSLSSSSLSPSLPFFPYFLPSSSASFYNGNQNHHHFQCHPPTSSQNNQ